MDFDLETMNSACVGPFGQVSGLTTLCSDIRPLATNWRRDTASFIWTRLSYQELTTLLLHDTIKQCWEFHYLGGEQQPSRVPGSSDFGLGVFFCVWFPLGACSCSVALLSFGRLVLRIRGTNVISRLQHSSAVACPRKSLMSKC